MAPRTSTKVGNGPAVTSAESAPGWEVRATDEPGIVHFLHDGHLVAEVELADLGHRDLAEGSEDRRCYALRAVLDEVWAQGATFPRQEFASVWRFGGSVITVRDERQR